MYKALGNKIVFQHRDGEQDDCAVCDDAAKAVELLNEAGRLNDKRQYTNSARKTHIAESLSGFVWTN